MRLLIEYNHSKCVGSMLCVRSSGIFEDNSGQARLIGSVNENALDVLETNLPEKESLDIIQAATMCPSNAIKVVDLDSGNTIVDNSIDMSSCKRIDSTRVEKTEMVIDPNGYFLIRISDGFIEAGYCDRRNHMALSVRGRKPNDVYRVIVEKVPSMRKEHYAYLGKELQKAYIASKLGITYVQDEELIFSR